MGEHVDQGLEELIRRDDLDRKPEYQDDRNRQRRIDIKLERMVSIGRREVDFSVRMVHRMDPP